VFETSAGLTALAAWNALPAQTTTPWFLAGTEHGTWFAGTSNNLSVGDALLFVAAPGGTPDTANGPAELHFITAVSTDPVVKATQVSWDAPLSSSAFASGVNVYVFRKKAALFGASAPDAVTQSTSLNLSTSSSSSTATSASAAATSTTPPSYAAWGNSLVVLDAVYPGLGPGPDGSPQWLALTMTVTPRRIVVDTSLHHTGTFDTGLPEGGSAAAGLAERAALARPRAARLGDTAATAGDIRVPDRTAILAGSVQPAPVAYATLFTVSSARDDNPRNYNLTSRATALTVGTPLPLAGIRQTPGIYTTADGLLGSYIPNTPHVTAYAQSEQLTGAPLPLTDWTSVEQQFRAIHIGSLPLRLLLAGWPSGMLPPIAGPSVAVAGGQQVQAGQPAAVSGKRVRLQVAAGANSVFTPAGAAAAAQADGQVFLIDAFPPAIDSAANAIWSVLTTSGVAGTLSLPLAGPLAGPLPTLQPADNRDPAASEAVVVHGVTPGGDATMLNGDATTLNLAAPLSRLYDRSTVTVNVNAVLATHGQTVQEILGSGDATNAALTLTLKQAPLTYLTAPVSSGAQSTLQVWVNNLRWQEVSSLLAAGPADRVYTTSVEATGHTVVRFGDGTRGSRPPTGQANIRAVYRTGTGTAGMVAAGQLSQPLDRPQGLSLVTNPSAATGAQDPATADEVRASAPLPTLALGRVVSLQDYQDYALGFAGIAKALATYSWSGDRRGVFLTVAGAAGAVLAPGDPVVSSLLTALRQSGDPNVPLTIASHIPVLFTFTASVAVDTTSYSPSAVLGQAWQAVSAVFTFGSRGLGQGVAASEIIEVIQGVPGVLAVRLTGLQRSGQPATAAAVLRASGPQPPLGAELLLLDPATQGQLGSWS
jgi:hypothetical protein